MSGVELEQQLEKLIAFRKLPADRRAPRPDARRRSWRCSSATRGDKAFFADRDKRRRRFADALTTPTRARQRAARRGAPGLRRRRSRIAAAVTRAIPPRRSELRDDQRVPDAGRELPGREGHQGSDDRQGARVAAADERRPTTPAHAAATTTPRSAARRSTRRPSSRPSPRRRCQPARRREGRGEAARRRRQDRDRSTSSSSSSSPPARRASRSTATRASAR